MEVVFAENGREGIEKLQANPDVDVVLVDIMMPEMDGYETMQEIRRTPRYADLPLIAVTAKAMKGDREKCIEAGATDYVSKPVDIDQLLAVLRVQLGRQHVYPDGTIAPNGAAETGLSIMTDDARPRNRARTRTRFVWSRLDLARTRLRPRSSSSTTIPQSPRRRGDAARSGGRDRHGGFRRGRAAPRSEGRFRRHSSRRADAPASTATRSPA